PKVDRERNDRIVRPQARALIDSPLLEIEIAAQEGHDVRSSPENTHDAGAIFVGQAFLGLERAEHAARDLRLLDERNLGAKGIAQKQRGAAACEAGADHQYFHRGYFIAALGEFQVSVHRPKGAVEPGCRACTLSGSAKIRRAIHSQSSSSGRASSIPTAGAKESDTYSGSAAFFPRRIRERSKSVGGMPVAALMSEPLAAA